MLFEDITIIDDSYTAQEHMYLVTEGNTITYLDSTPPADYTGERYKGADKVILPGFFNLHCHVPMTLLRGYGEGLCLQDWLHQKIFPFEALMTSEDMYWGSLLGIAEMIKSGAVSFTDMYMRLEGVCKAVDESGIKANLSNGIVSFDPQEKLQANNGYNDLVTIRSYAAQAGHDRIIADLSMHAEYTSHEGMVREAAAFAKEQGLRMHVHISETKREHEECKATRGMTSAQYLNKCGLFDVPTTAAHCVWIEGEDFDIFADKGVTVATCPSSNLKLGSGVAPIKQMLDRGVRVGIGTDGAASNNNLNMLEEVNLVSMVQKGINGDPLFLAPKQLLELACRNGALAQGRTDCGSIKVGNRADLVVYDLDRPHLQPVYDVLANVIYAGQAEDICLTMIDGKVVYKDGIFTSIDLEQVLYHAKRIGKEKLTQLQTK